MENHDRKRYVSATLMDLSKAFDTLNLDLLLAKLHAYCFSEESLKLIKSYLTNRWQRAKVNITFSSWSELLKDHSLDRYLGPLLLDRYLGPLLFNIMTYFIALNRQIFATMPTIQYFMLVIQI